MKNKLLLKTINRLVDSSFKDGKMIESKVTKAIRALKTLPKVDSIFALTEFLAGLKRMERSHTMFLETAIPFSSTQIKRAKKIIDKLSFSSNKKIKITKVRATVNPDILGGFKLRVGDEIWDESVLGKINQVKEEITHGRSN